MLGWHLDPDPLPESPIDLSFDEFERAVRMLEEIGFPTERTAEEAWPDFHGWRVNYETAAYRLADRLVVPPAPWSGTRRHVGPDIVEPRRPPHRRPTRSAEAFARHLVDPPRPTQDPLMRSAKSAPVEDPTTDLWGPSARPEPDPGPAESTGDQRNDD